MTLTKNLSLAVLAATTSALAACASPTEPGDAAATSAATASLPSGCAIAARQGELTVEILDTERLLVTFYDAKGRAYEAYDSHTFQAELRYRHNADGSISALSRATGGGPVFTLTRSGDGYRLAFSRDNGQEGGYEEWESFTGNATCATHGVPALPVPLAPAAPKTVSADARLEMDHLPKTCTTTAPNAKGELFELQGTRKGWGDTSYWTFVRYDAAGHADIATHTFGESDGDTFALQDFDKQDGPDGAPKVTIGEIAPKRGADGKVHFVLTPSDRVFHPKIHQEARFTDVVGSRPLELRCEY